MTSSTNQRLSRNSIEAARDREELFRTVVNTAPVMLWMSGTDKMRTTFLNEGWLKFTGRTMEEELGIGWASGVHPEDVDRCLETYGAAFDSRVEFEMEYRLRRFDGEYRWIFDRGAPSFASNGTFGGYVGSCVDVTERKQAEEALRASQEQLQAIWNNSPAVMFIKDRDGRYLDVNPLSVNRTSLTREQILGKTDDEIFPSEQAAAYRANDLRVLEENRPIKCEETVEQKEGVRTEIVQKFPLRDAQGQPYAICGFVTDITERKVMELALRESEERLRLAAQAGKMYAFDWDVITDVIIRTEEGEGTHIFGETGESIDLTKQQLLASVHPEDRAKFVNSIVELTPESPNTQISYRFLRPDGSVLWLERTGHAFFDEQSKMVRMIGMVADITERKRAEETLSGVGGRLIEAQEKERTRIARELHDDIGQRLALLANDLRLMEQNPPDSVAEVSNRASEQLKRVHEIAADVQAMSHRLHSSKLQLLGVVAAAKGFCQEFSEQQKVKIDFTHVDIPPAVPEEISLCLFRVLQEALQNAVKHSGAQQFKVELRGVLDGIQLMVRDAGLGFDPEAVVNNRGLGLVSMQERTSLVNGTFSIESGPKLGTTIRVRVPLSSRKDAMRAGG